MFLEDQEDDGNEEVKNGQIKLVRPILRRNSMPDLSESRDKDKQVVAGRNGKAGSKALLRKVSSTQVKRDFFKMNVGSPGNYVEKKANVGKLPSSKNVNLSE